MIYFIFACSLALVAILFFFAGASYSDRIHNRNRRYDAYEAKIAESNAMSLRNKAWSTFSRSILTDFTACGREMLTAVMTKDIQLCSDAHSKFVDSFTNKTCAFQKDIL